MRNYSSSSGTHCHFSLKVSLGRRVLLIVQKYLDCFKRVWENRKRVQISSISVCVLQQEIRSIFFPIVLYPASYRTKLIFRKGNGINYHVFSFSNFTLLSKENSNGTQYQNFERTNIPDRNTKWNRSIQTYYLQSSIRSTAAETPNVIESWAILSNWSKKYSS